MSTCPFDFEEGFVYKVPSVRPFCACPRKSGYTEEIEIREIGGECNSADIAEGCVTSEKQEEREASLWRNERRICVKRDSSQSLFTDITNQSAACAGGNSCGFGACITGGSCPITRAVVSEESASPGEEWEEVLGLGSEHLWVFRQREGEYPVGELKLAEHAFCVETDNYGRTPNRKEFKYMESNSNQKVCSTVDDTVAEIDSLGEETFFTSNNISIDIPGFPRFSNEFVWKLGAKQLVHWNANCRANEEYNLKTAEERLSLDEIYDLNVGYIVVTSFSVVVAIVIASIDLVKRYSNAEVASAKQHFQQKQLKSAFLIVDIFAKLICVPIIGI